MIKFLSIILPSIIILLPIILFLAYSLIIKKNVRKKILISGILFMILGLVTPWIATFISAYGLTAYLSGNEPKCVNGAGIFIFYGYLINLAGIPLFGLLFYILDKNDKIILFRQDKKE